MGDSLRSSRSRTVRSDGPGDVVEAAAPRTDDTLSMVKVLNAISEAAVGVDAGGTIRMANEAALELFGYPMERLVGGSIDRLVPDSVRARHRPLMKSFFEQPTARPMGAGTPLTARRFGGDVFFADISLASVDSAAFGPLALLVVRDVSEERRERLIAAQYLITHTLVSSETLEEAAAGVLEAIGPASGGNVAALWRIDNDGAARFVDSWCASARERVFHTESVDVVAPAGSGVLGGVVADGRVFACSDVLAEPRFQRKDLAKRLHLRAGVWVPITDGDDRVRSVLEILFGVVREADPGMLRMLEIFAAQLAQYQALRRSEADHQRVLGQVVQSVEDERRRIASELHDDTVQVLVASMISIDRLKKVIDPDDPAAHELLAGLRETLADATERTRHLIFDLRPQLLEAEGVTAAIAEAANLAGRRAGFAVDVSGTRDRFDPAVETLLYRVMQEAITNTRKHANATSLRCSLQPEAGGVTGEVTDDGVGFELEDTLARARERLSFGLSTILELVRLAGGNADVESAVGRGTTVRAWLPLRLTPRGLASTLRMSRTVPPTPRTRR